MVELRFYVNDIHVCSEQVCDINGGLETFYKLVDQHRAEKVEAVIGYKEGERSGEALCGCKGIHASGCTVGDKQELAARLAALEPAPEPAPKVGAAAPTFTPSETASDRVQPTAADALPDAVKQVVAEMQSGLNARVYIGTASVDIERWDSTLSAALGAK